MRKPRRLTYIGLVPCKLLAENLRLNIHQRKTFTGWDVSLCASSLSTSWELSD